MMNKKRTIRVMCVDDHLFLIDGLKARFMTQSDLEFVGSLPTADDLVDEAMRLQADIVLVDIEMAGQDPFVSIDDLRRRYPDARAIILSAYVRDHYISAALKAGAWGYFSKSDSPMEIMAGIREVADGNFAFGQKVQERCEGIKAVQKGNVKPPRSRLENLSPRELEVLRLIGRGMTRSAIAQLLCRSPKTIDGHRESIMEKLDIHDRGELLRFAIREGLAEA
ncbi:MAG: response regulator transcription factor [Planctomycetes bacterium]|nr:response regulator transcription factor [Planctomycetota bacterium]